MNPRILLALRLIFSVGFLGAVAAQVVLIIQLIADSQENGELTRTPLLVLVAAIIVGLGCVEVVIVCVFQLLHLVAHNRIFNRQAFRWVDTITVAIAAAAVLVLAAGYVAAELDDAPGLVLVSFLVALLISGVALLVYVQRSLLAQAVHRDHQAQELESELNEVI